MRPPKENYVRVASENQYAGEYDYKKFLVLRSGADDEKRVGIYAHGGCDIAAIFASAPLIQRTLSGTCGIVHGGITPNSRSDAILQTLNSPPKSVTTEVIRKLKLPRDFFRPELFEKSFRVPRPARDGFEEFPKTVVVVSVGPDAARVAYRHKEHGIIVDPGGLWLTRPMEEVLGSLEIARWFRDNFSSIGRIPLDESMHNFSKIIRHLKQHTSQHVLVMNLLNPEPRSSVHNYQLMQYALPVRKREFNLALVELSRQLDFSILDMNRTLQRAGIRDMVDWFHTHPRQYLPIAQELFRILQDRGVF